MPDIPQLQSDQPRDISRAILGELQGREQQHGAIVGGEPERHSDSPTGNDISKSADVPESEREHAEPDLEHCGDQYRK